MKLFIRLTNGLPPVVSEFLITFMIAFLTP